MKYLRSLLSQDGSISMMRIMSLLCCIAAIAIAFVGMNKPVPDYSGLSLLCSAFLTSAFGGKILQKSLESKAAAPVKPEL